MKLLCLILLCLGVYSHSLESAKALIFPQSILDTLQNRFSSSHLGGRFAISLYSSKYNRYEIKSNDNQWFTPASCLKIFVTGTSMHHFPINHFFETKVQLKGNLHNKTFKGNITFIGSGDPNISGRFFEQENGIMSQWIDSLKALGIDTISGKIEFRDDRFPGSSKPPYWKKNYYNKWYGAEVSALSYNDNCYNVKVIPADSLDSLASVQFLPNLGFTKVTNKVLTVSGKKSNIIYKLHPDSNIIFLEGTLGQNSQASTYTFPVRNPTDFFKSAFLYFLKEKGVTYSSQEEPNHSNPTLQKTFRFKTAPTTNIYEEINQRSQNLHAELLLRSLGVHVKEKGTREAGIQAEKEFLHHLGVDSGSFQFYDASGLSTSNKIKPQALVMYLHKMSRQPYGKAFIQSLATPGVHGYKGKRLKHLKNKIKIKTGFINGVQGLTGYIFTQDGDTLSFALFLNGYQSNYSVATQFIDSSITYITSQYNRSQTSIDFAKKLYTSPNLPTHYPKRLIYFSKKLIGKPYKGGPTGEGRNAHVSPAPLVNLNEFDCVTYIEHVMALSQSSNAQSLIPTLNKIRYLKGEPQFRQRKHFFIEDWIKQSPEWVQLVRFPNDTTATKISDKKKFYGFKKMDYKQKNPTTTLSYVPYDKAIQLMENWTYGEKFLGVGFVTKIPWLWVTHTGFLDATQMDSTNRPLLRHASSKQKKVATVDFKEYLLSRKGKCLGVVFFEFKKPTLK